VDEVKRTHPRLITTDGTFVDNHRYQDPSSFMAGRPPASPEPIEGEPPALVLLQPQPAIARHAVAELSRGSAVAPAVVDDLIIAVSEVVTNAILHGRAPATLRGWAGPSCIVVTVHDCGRGPADPLVGLVRTDKGSAVGGFGLWIAHQLCHRVTLEADHAGFTVRLVAANPPAARGLR
jgi:anti-sigma regulatory factor (Ser/Thr protein kinase)